MAGRGDFKLYSAGTSAYRAGRTGPGKEAG